MSDTEHSDPEPEPEPTPEPEARTGERCEAETTAGGNLYQCALTEGHPGEHSFSVVEAEDNGQPDSATASNKALKQLDAEAIRHNKRVQEIMGDDSAFLVQCELCPPNLAGWRFDSAPSEDVTARVRVVIGLPDLENYRPSATEHRCDDCGGLGRVRSGSLIPAHEALLCDACHGKGYVASRPRLAPVPDEPAAALVPNGDSSDWGDGIKRDMFGTPETDPDYGMMPNMRQRPTDYWQQNRV